MHFDEHFEVSQFLVTKILIKNAHETYMPLSVFVLEFAE